jgi:uncharacterized membrane protein YphA (DoxX/SURF4 family)
MPLPSFTNTDEQPSGRNRDDNPSHSGPFLLTDPGHDSAAAVFLWLGRLFLGVSFLAFGFQEFRFAGDVPDLGLVPSGAPAHRILGWLAGGILLAGAASILTGKYLRFTTLVLGPAFLLAAVARFFFHIPELFTSTPYRTVFFELISCCAGSWMFASLLPVSGSHGESSSLTERLGVIGYWLFAVASISYGIGHFQDSAFVASVIPDWIPSHLFVTWFTGAALIVAGLAMAARVWARPAAALLGLMFFLWVVLLHAPRIMHAPHDGDEWNSGFVCLTMSGCALLAAALAPRLHSKSR